MNKVVAALALLSASGVMAVGDTCTKTLGLALGLTNTEIVTPSIAATGAKYCTNLEANSCCSATVLNTFQDKADALVTKVSDIVAARDKFLIATRKELLGEIASQLTALKKASSAAMTKLGNSVDTELEDFDDEIDFLRSGSSNLVSSFSTYQKARVTCANAAIKLQIAALCLACDPNQGTNGVVSNEIVFSDATKKALVADCYPYLSNSAEQNVISKFNYISDKLTAYTAALNKISSSGAQSDVDAFIALISSNAVADLPKNANETPVTLPANCESSTNCAWITTVLFDAGSGLDTTSLAEGGVALEYTEDDNENENESETNGNRRVLAGANEYTPDYTKVGVTVNFPENPGKVDNTKSAQLIEGAVVCAGVLAMGLMI